MVYIVTNNGIIKGNALQISADRPVYEVIRVIDGIALFLECHFERLVSSVQIRGLQLEMGFSEFRHHISELTKINRKLNGNVKFVLYEAENINQWSFTFIPHIYPSPNDYLMGVETGLLFAERDNPNAKIIQNTISEIANQMITDKKLHEVLLVDRNGMITEGSRSNVFFVKGNRFYTAPTTKVLVGVTRTKVMECLVELNFTIIEEAVSISEIGTFDAIFLTGTSPKVLPVHCIDNIQFQAKNFFVEKLMARYDLKIETYLKARMD